MSLIEINSINPIDRFTFINNFTEDDLTNAFVGRMWSGSYNDESAKGKTKERLKYSPEEMVAKVDKLDRQIRNRKFMAVVFAIAAVALFALTISTGGFGFFTISTGGFGFFIAGLVAYVLTLNRYESMKNHAKDKEKMLNEIPNMRENLKLKIGENLNKIAKMEKKADDIKDAIKKIESEPDLENETRELTKEARQEELNKLNKQIAEDELRMVRWQTIWDKIDDFLKTK